MSDEPPDAVKVYDQTFEMITFVGNRITPKDVSKLPVKETTLAKRVQFREINGWSKVCRTCRTASVFLLFNLTPAIQIYVSYIRIHPAFTYSSPTGILCFEFTI